LRDEVAAAPIEYFEGTGAAPAPSIDLFPILAAALRRWKLITAITLCALTAAYCVAKLVPPGYKSTVEILVYDPQGQIDAAVVQKPISPFVDAISYEAMNTEIKIIKSKSVALRVATELGLDTDPEFQPHNRLAELVKRLGFPYLSQADDSAQTIGEKEEKKAEKLDAAADALLGGLQVWPESYIISVSTTAQSPIKAQRIASTIANDYLASQLEARQAALQRVAAWLKSRVDDLQSQVLEAESSIEKLKEESGITDTGLNNVSDQQIQALNAQLMAARGEVTEQRARLEEAHRLFGTNGGVQSVPELIASEAVRKLVRQGQSGESQIDESRMLPELLGSSDTMINLRQKREELIWRIQILTRNLGEHHAQVIAANTELEGINKRMNTEADHAIAKIQGAYDIAIRRQQSFEASLEKVTAARGNSTTYLKLQQLQRVAEADRKLYENYLSQYNEIAQRRTMLDTNARIISPANLSRSPNPSRRMVLYALGGMAGLGGGFLLAFLLEYFRPGVKTETEIERSFGRPVVGIIPLVQHRKLPGTPYHRLLHRMVDEPLSHFSEAVHAMRISLELSSANPKVILITSALPAEGKSTAAMLLAASSASSGKRTLLLDCDFRQRSASQAFGTKREPGMSEFLRGTAKLNDVITQDPMTKAFVIPAGSMVPNVADLLMSQRMRDLIAVLRNGFDYIVMDTSPLLPVIDALALTTVADKVLIIVEWGHTSRANISEAFKVLRPEAHRVAGIILNKVDLKQLYGYGYHGRYHYRSVANT
jgi:capsular exopolysaccharide synthesis family protein